VTLSDRIALASVFLSAASFLVSIAISVVVAVWTNRLSKASASAGTIVTLNQAFREAWGHLSYAEDEIRKEFAIAELLNLLEIACAIRLEKSLSPKTKKLIDDYLKNVIQALKRNPSINAIAKQLIQASTTFEFIKQYHNKFIRQKRKRLSVVIPPEWYE
jgi:hypothetical protein